MANRTAIVTLALGRRYLEPWHRWAAPNWARYAERHSYDVICIDHALDDSQRARGRSPTWQKCLILDQPFANRYERIVWIDADVMINPAAPAVTAHVPIDHVGAVDEFSTPTPELHAEALSTLYRHWEQTRQAFARNETIAEYYEAYGLPSRSDGVVQAGVMVLSPEHHRDLLLGVYDRYEDQSALVYGEMRPLSYELLEARCVTWLDPRFNFTWSGYRALHFPFLLNAPDHPRALSAARSALADVYMLHFTGGVSEVRLVEGGPSEPPLHSRLAHWPEKVSRRDSGWQLHTPVVLLLYARPDTTRRVLEQIRRVRPTRLLVVSDAPPQDAHRSLRERVDATRGLLDTIDWDCEVTTEFAAEHQGMNRRVVSGLDWAFSLVEEAIVLEDDCVPEPSFFRFCEELLERYRDDDQVISIAGNDFSSDRAARADCYRFSRYTLVWGWATWRRAWRLYDASMCDWPKLRDSGWLNQVLGDRHAVAYWTHIMEQAYADGLGWDYAWTFACWRYQRLAIHPEVNLVTNIGFGPEATNTDRADSVFANLPTQSAAFPLVHPERIARDEDADSLLEDVMFSGNLARLFGRIRRGRELARDQGLR